MVGTMSTVEEPRNSSPHRRNQAAASTRHAPPLAAASVTTMLRLQGFSLPGGVKRYSEPNKNLVLYQNDYDATLTSHIFHDATPELTASPRTNRIVPSHDCHEPTHETTTSPCLDIPKACEPLSTTAFEQKQRLCHCLDIRKPKKNLCIDCRLLVLRKASSHHRKMDASRLSCHDHSVTPQRLADVTSEFEEFDDSPPLFSLGRMTLSLLIQNRISPLYWIRPA
jgi:hypothetical protein